jgi:hypothetical protein
MHRAHYKYTPGVTADGRLCNLERGAGTANFDRQWSVGRDLDAVLDLETSSGKA